MKDQMQYYKYYEKLMKLQLDQSIVKTSEYSSFSKIYPHIAESIRLKRAIKRLNNRLKSEKVRSLKFNIKRELNITKTNLRKNNLLKRLHGESKQEAIFQRKFKLYSSKIRFSMLAEKYTRLVGQPIRNFRKRFKRSMHKNLPPSLFNLRELDVAEKGLALREWIQKNGKKIQ